MAAPSANPQKPHKPVIKCTTVQMILKSELLHVTFSHVSVAPTGHLEHISLTAQLQEKKTMERYGSHLDKFGFIQHGLHFLRFFRHQVRLGLHPGSEHHWPGLRLLRLYPALKNRNSFSGKALPHIPQRKSQLKERSEQRRKGIRGR